MTKKSTTSKPYAVIFLLSILILSHLSCVKYPQILYFRNQSEFTPLSGHNITNHERLVIKPDDILSVIVKTLLIETATPFNLFETQELLRNNNPALTGYLVDTEGFIDFPILGRLKVAGLTSEETQKMIEEKLTPYLDNPTVIIRFMNFRFTVLGEVASPGALSVQGERVTILEALGQAGDLTAYSNRQNIMLIREKFGEREIGYIDIQSPSLFDSPYFYLQQNDVIYVEPLKQKTATIRDPVSEILPIISGALSLVAVSIALISR